MSNKSKKQDSSWKNFADYHKGKARLEIGVLQHPDEDAGNKSVFNFMKGQVTKRKQLHIMPFGQFERMGKNK